MTHDDQIPSEYAHREADELVVDGLLRYHHDQDESARSARKQRVMDALRTEEYTDLAFSQTSHRKSRRLRRWSVPLAAMIIIVNALVLIGFPNTPSAYAQVSRSIEALQSVGFRRYEVWVNPLVNQNAPAPRKSEPNAYIDMNATESMMIRHRPPHHGDWLIAGRDAQGDWAIDSDNQILRGDIRAFLPPWSLDNHSLLVNSIDRVLEQTLTQYKLQSPEKSEDGSILIIADRNLGMRGPQPEQVIIRIDPETELPSSIHMVWLNNDGRESRVPESNATPTQRPAPGQHPRLSSITFELVEFPQWLDESWFDPHSHTSDP